MTIVILNGPNLNLLGKREPHIYGTITMEQYLYDLRQLYPHVNLLYHQSNHEGDLIDWIQQYGDGTSHGIVLNAGGYTHTSVAIRDAIAAVPTAVAEVHISDITKREPFRRQSLLTEVCRFSIMGHGMEGYRMAIDKLLAI